MQRPDILFYCRIYSGADKEAVGKRVLPIKFMVLKTIRTGVIVIITALISLQFLFYVHNRCFKEKSCTINGITIERKLPYVFIPILSLPLDILYAALGDGLFCKYYYIFSDERGEVRFTSPITEELSHVGMDAFRIVELPDEKRVFARVTGDEHTEIIRVSRGNWHDVDPWGMRLVELTVSQLPFSVDEYVMTRDSASVLHLLKYGEKSIALETWEIDGLRGVKLFANNKVLSFPVYDMKRDVPLSRVIIHGIHDQKIEIEYKAVNDYPDIITIPE